MKKVITILIMGLMVSLNAQDKKVVLITGTASGFGKATAEKLVDKGYIVYGGDIKVEENKYLDEIGGHALVMDVTNDEQVLSGVQKVIDEQGHIDVLVNNAGYGTYGMIEDVPIEEIINQYNVNVFGYGRLIKAILPHMREARRGRIINVSSVVGEVSMAGLGWYASTKHAIEAISDALRAELTHLEIDVVKIQPGGVNTNFDEVAFGTMERITPAPEYERLHNNFYDYMVEMYKSAPGPEETANTIVEAIEAKKPKTEYRTAGAGMMMKMKGLFSERRFDKMILQQIHKIEKD